MHAATSGLFRLPHDVRHAVRQALRNPGLTAIVIFSLAIGIGANSAIFSLVHAMMLRELPVPEPDSLLALQYAEPGDEWHPLLEHIHNGRGSRDTSGRPVSLSISWPAYTYLRTHARRSVVAGFVPLGMFDRPVATLNGQPTFVDVDMVTASCLPAVGISPAIGRGIEASDERADAPRVAVLSYRFWNRVYAASRGALGSTLLLNGVPVTVVGVAPASFTGLETGRSPDMWIQMGPQPGLIPWGGAPKEAPGVAYASPGNWWLQVVVRRKPGVTTEQARAELERLFRQSLLLEAGGPVPADRLPEVRLTPASRGFNTVGRRYSTPLTVLMVGVGLVLLVACANVATLLLARSASRRKEMAVRLALGAPRARLVRQLLVESAVYAAGGALLGVIFASWGARALLVLMTAGRDPIPLDVGLDAAVLGFTALVTLATTVLFGLAPALNATRLDLASNLTERIGGTATIRRAGAFGGGRLLVAAQVAMSLPLVLGAGLFVRTLDSLERERLGFDPDKLVVFNLDPSKAGVSGARLLTAYAGIQERLAALPGVRGVTASRLGLMSGTVSSGGIRLDTHRAEAGAGSSIHYNIVAPRFFETMRIPVVLGRSLDGRDTPDGTKVAVVNETFARRLLPGQNPIGRRFWFGRTREEGQAVEIVGVVGDAKYASVRAPAPPTAYLPYTQSHIPLTTMVFEVRTAGDPMSLVGSIARAVGEVVPGVPLGRVKTQAAQIAQSLGQETMYARLFTSFGAVALLLACVGLYGTLSYTLARRTREIGIRMALGAPGGRVLRASLLDALRLAGGGLALGGVLAVAGARYVRSLLFEVTPLDVPTLVTAALVMLACAVAAAWVPARRASRLDPLQAMRAE